MTTFQFMVGFYSLSAIAIVLLLARFFRRRRRERKAAERLRQIEAGLLKSDVQSEPLVAQPAVAEPVSLAAADSASDSPATNGVGNEASADDTNTPNESVSQQPADVSPVPVRPRAATAAASSTEVSWTNRKLFAEIDGRSDRGNDLPRLEPHEIPLADTSDYVFGTVTPLLAELLPDTDSGRKLFKKELVGAGYYKPHALHNLAAICYVGIMLPLFFFGFLLLMVPAQMEMPVILMMVVFSIVGWAIPRLYVRNRSKERKRQIEVAIPDMLDMLNMCVSQGITVVESLRRISADLGKVYPALADELAIIDKQAEVGTLEHALTNFSDRVDVPEVHSFTTLINQTERMGTSVSAALVEYSDNMRENLRQRADEKANQAAFRMLFPTVLFMMPAVYIFLLGPAIIELSDFFNVGGGRDAVQSGRQQAVEQLNN